MGTEHNAQVEIFCEERPPHLKACWASISRWDLGKDYGFARAFYSVASDLWPKDADSIIGEMDEAPEMFDGKRYCDGAVVALLEPVDDVEWSLWAKELCAHCGRIAEAGYQVRVLWWEV